MLKFRFVKEIKKNTVKRESQVLIQSEQDLSQYNLTLHVYQPILCLESALKIGLPSYNPLNLWNYKADHNVVNIHLFIQVSKDICLHDR